MGRSPCCDKDGLKKGPWTPEEDQKLVDFIQKHGYGNWRTLPKNAGLQRCGKSCRLRWTNYLRPDIKRGKFSFEEEESIIQLHSVLGNKWSAIAARLPGRTDNEIKNFWNTHIRKRLLRMGIDPVTHSPRLDLLDLSTILNSSLHNNISSHQIHNLSRLLGVQHLVNPELLKLANSLISSRENSYFLQQTPLQENQYLNPRLQNDQIVPLVQYSQFQENQNIIPTGFSTPCVPFSGDAQAQAQLMQPNVNNFNEWGSNGMASNLIPQESYVPVQDYIYHGADQTTTDKIYCDNTYEAYSNQFPKHPLSTPSSTSTPTRINSNSTYVTSSSTTTEDEKESHCSNYMYTKFEIPDILDVNEFM